MVYCKYWPVVEEVQVRVVQTEVHQAPVVREDARLERRRLRAVEVPRHVLVWVVSEIPIVLLRLVIVYLQEETV